MLKGHVHEQIHTLVPQTGAAFSLHTAGLGNTPAGPTIFAESLSVFAACLSRDIQSRIGAISTSFM